MLSLRPPHTDHALDETLLSRTPSLVPSCDSRILALLDLTEELDDRMLTLERDVISGSILELLRVQTLFSNTLMINNCS